MKRKSDTPCIVCNNTPTDSCHIRTKAASGINEDWNLVQMCRYHHQLQHSMGWVKFINNHKHIMSILRSKGWEIDEVLGKKQLVRYVE